jgi:sugar phosphate isomerase/epimerase
LILFAVFRKVEQIVIWWEPLMNRRTFLQAGIGATIGASVVGELEAALAQTPGERPGGSPAPSREQSTVAPRKLTLDAYSRHLHWLRTPDEVAEAVFETGCDGVMLTVQPYPGHIDPERVSQDLPPFVKTLRQRGLRVTQIQGPDINDAGEPTVEAIIRAGSELGITHYWFGAFKYDLTKPVAPQLDSVKLGLDKFVKLNQKHHTIVVFHTYADPTAVGSTVWDLVSVMKNFDPKYVGFHWDTGDMALHGGDMWDVLMRAAGPYVASVAWADRGWQQDLGLKGEGGPFPGLSAIPQGGRGGRGRGAAGAGRGGGPGARGAEPNAAPGEEAAGEAGAEGQAGGAAGRGPGGRGGGFGGPHTVPLPLGGLIARGAGWSSPIVPFGSGIIEVPKIAMALRDINFNGPSLLEAEYQNGGAGEGLDKISLPRQWVLGAMKRDVLTLRSAFMLAPEAGLSI